MDWEAFERNVWESVNETRYTEQWGSLDDSDPDSGFTGHVVTMGETWLGALYVAIEDYDGGKRVELFDTPKMQREYYERQIAKWETNH